MNDITGIVVQNYLQEKLNKYQVYYNSSYQYGDYDMSDYYELKIKELELKINKIIWITTKNLISGWKNL